MLLVRLGPVSALRAACGGRKPCPRFIAYSLIITPKPPYSRMFQIDPGGGLVNRKGRPLRAFYPGISPYGLGALLRDCVIGSGWLSPTVLRSHGMGLWENVLLSKRAHLKQYPVEIGLQSDSSLTTKP